MSRAFACLAAVFLAASNLLAQAPARDTPAPTGTAIIRGRVLAAGASEHPLARVEVRAICGPLRVNQAVLTGGDGRYEIGELPAGRYTVSFTRPNYVRASYGQRRPLGPGAAIDVATGQIVSRVDVVLQQSSVVTGRILDEFGDPVTGAQVMPMRYAFINGERRLVSSGPSGTSNDLGEYRLFGLTPGQHFVSAAMRSFGYGETNDRFAYAPTYYPGTGNLAEARRLTVAAGQTIAGINLTLLPVAAAHISGVALDGQGRPLAGANVFLSQRLGGMFGSSAQVRPNGAFSIGGVTPGEYNLRASIPGVPDESGSADVTVTGADVTDVQLVIVKPSTLRGRVVFEMGDAKPPVASSVRLIASPSGAMSSMAGNGNPKDDGTFELRVGAGRAVLRATVFGTGDWSLKRVLTPAGVDVLDAGLDVPVNVTLEGLVVEMTSRHSEVSGTVVDAAGAQVRDCVVVVFAQDPLRWSTQSRYYGSSRPDQNNVFHMRMPAGDYYAAAFEEPDPAVSFNDPDVLQQLRDRATKFSIAENEKAKLELPLGQPPVY